ncbi:hypothetical protein M9Y10_004364 [Tritrichomonas musculus]|uniref:Uncharacterized protein n=1 Tax=Tritrichomonas musculus TaxID=1915356 RepID=A0ABR2JS61_9EUKA
MFDNLIESINAQLPLTDESKELIKAVAKTPNLSYPGIDQKTQSSNTDKNRLPTQELDKASLLRLIRTSFLCSPDNKNYAECKLIKDSIIQQNHLQKILSQLSDFQFIVGVETLIALQAHNSEAVLSDESYQTELVKTANSAPKHLRPLYGFALLQLLGFRQLYKNPTNRVKKLPKIAQEALTRKIYSPILFASFLDAQESENTLKILKQFDVFAIILNKWIEPMTKILLEEVKRICIKELFYLISRFLRLYYSKSILSQSIQTFSSRILPLMSRIVLHYPKLFNKFLDDCNIFANKNLTENRFPSVLHFLSCSCNSKQNALTVLKKLTNSQNRSEPLMKQFFDCLKEAHDELVVENVSSSSKSALFLLKSLFKYLSNNLKEKLVMMFNGSEIDTPAESLSSFLWDFMDNSELAPSAAKCLFHLSSLYPDSVSRYFDNPSTFISIEGMMEKNAKIAKSFVKIARNMVSFTFCRSNDKSKEIPKFAKFLVSDYFTSSIFKKFERRSKRWSTLTSILELALDIVYCDLDFCEELPNNENFVRGLISIVHQTASILSEPPTVIIESDSVRIDSDNLRYIIQFDSIAMTLMIRLITCNLMNLNSKLSFMCTSFFSDNFSDASSLFTTFVSFLQLTHPLSPQLRVHAVKMLDLMCEIASRIPGTNVDSFYPHESQRVLKGLISTNLFKSNCIDQVITQIDFIAHTLSSQLPFAYSFVHHLGSSFVFAATSYLEDIAKKFPDWLLSLSRLLSMMFQKLSLGSEVIMQITSKQAFWSSLWNIIKLDLPSNDNNQDTCNLIAAKSELLNVAILNNQPIQKEVIDILFNQIQTILPKKFEPIFIDFKIDMKRFIMVELHRIYGKDFYLDTELLRRYLVDKENIVAKAKSLNESWSIIHACTQLLSTIVNLLRTTSNESLIPPVKDSLKLLINVLRNDIYYDSSTEVFFNFVDVCLSNIDSPINNISSNLLRGITYYLNKRPLESTFSIIARFLAPSEIEESEELIQMLDPCIKFSLENYATCSSSALKCASEIALKLSDNDNWIVKSPISVNCFFTLLPTPLGCSVVDFMTLVLMNNANASTLESSGFFEKFMTIGICESDSKSPIWPHIFEMMSAIPNVSQVPYWFVTTHISKIAYFFNPLTTTISSSELLLKSDNLMLYKTQLSIMKLLAKIAPNLLNFANAEDPVQYRMLLEIVSEKLRKSLLFLKESSQLNVSKGGNNLYDVDSYNEKTCNLLILHYCLLFFNCLFEFPKGDPPIILISSASSNPILDLMDKVADTLKEILANDAGIFNDVCIEAFEYALRIYTAKMFVSATLENGRKQIMETKNSLLRSIESVRKSIKDFNIKAQESFELLDAVNDFITNTI